MESTATGWLPSYCTKVALKKQRVRPVIAEINLPEGAELKSGQLRTHLKQLEGRSHTPAATIRSFGTANTGDRTKVEWVVKAQKGSEIELIARHDRAGVIRETVIL